MRLNIGETIDDLICNGLKIIQHQDSYKFALDAVLLANFVKASKNDTIIDLGTGSGVIPLLLSAKTNAKKLVGIELIEDIAKRAKRSVILNNLQDKISIVSGDMKKSPEIFGNESFSVVVSNPPYMTQKEGKISPNPEKAYARHELGVKLEEVIEVAQRLLVFSGRFFMIYRTTRLVDVLYFLRKYHLEPKNLRFICPNKNKGPNLFLLMAKKGGKPELVIQKPLIIYEDDGKYTQEIMDIYFGKSSRREFFGKS